MVRLPLWAMPSPAMNEKNQGTHHIYHGRYLDFEEGFEFFHFIYCHMGRIGNHVRKECRACAIGKKTRQDGVGKGDAHSGKEVFRLRDRCRQWLA